MNISVLLRIIPLLLTTLLVSGSAFHLSGQDTTRVYLLKEASVSGSAKNGTRDNSRYAPGTKNWHFKVSDLDDGKQKSLSDFIKTQTPLIIKEYGRSAGAYISLRGTSSSHTSIYWNGLDMSVPTLGQTDLSHIPLYFYDDVDIHVGGSSILYGNGSIGGSIHLKSEPKWEKGISGDIMLAAGSFGSLFSGGTVRYGGDKWESRTSLFYSGAKNSFRFKNNTRISHPVGKVNNASFRNAGVLEELFRMFRDKSVLSLTICYLDFHREIQPSVSNNDRPESYKSIYDNNFKTALKYRGSAGSRWHYNLHLSYSYDHELFEKDIIASHRAMGAAEGEYRTDRLSVKAGAVSKYTLPDVHAFSAGKYEWNNELFLLLNWMPFASTELSAGMRGVLVTDISVPLMPALNIRQIIIDNNSLKISLRGAYSESTKIPSLNDRYWGGDNTYLKPEEAKTIEGGADIRLLHRGWEITLFGTLYRTNVRNWIRWLPLDDVWKPRNIARVLSRGVESGVMGSKNIGACKLRLNLMYGYNNVVTKESERQNDPSIEKQLAYQPKHSINANIEVIYKKLSLRTSAQYVGKRTTTDIFDNLSPYLLLDVVSSYRFTLSRYDFKLSGAIKNILNTNYQNVKFYAMPGINFDVSLQWLF